MERLTSLSRNTKIILAAGVVMLGLLLISMVVSVTTPEDDDLSELSTCEVVGRLGELVAEARDEFEDAGATDEQAKAAIQSMIMSTATDVNLQSIMLGPILSRVYAELRSDTPTDVASSITCWCESAIQDKTDRPGEPTKAVNISI